ncbi:MAG: hypothetical protein ACK5MP_03595 [Nostocoides sp.]
MTIVSDPTTPPQGDRPTADRPRGVLAVVAADSGTDAETTLAALAKSTVRPERVLILDATPEGTLAATIGTERAETTERSETTPPYAVTVRRVDPGEAVRSAFGSIAADDLADVAALWLLPGGSEPNEDALRRLHEELRRSPVTGVVGPKLLREDDDQRSRIVSLGISATRSGRVIADPPEGAHDQGQFNDRRDVLAVSAVGALIEADTWRRLRGFRCEFVPVAADLDFGWRAQLNDRRVVVAPSARVLVPEGEGLAQTDTASARRDARRVALARCAWWAAPFLALWIALSSIGSALLLLLAKNPGAAGVEASSVAGVLDPWRPVRARWAAREERHIPRAHLRGLFLSPGVAVRQIGDEMSGAGELLAPDGPSEELTGSAVESGPGAEEDSFTDRGSPPQRVISSPALWIMLTLAAAALALHRTIAGGPLAALRGGLVGGELVGGPVRPSALAHAWWDAWPVDGAGPSALLLAVPAWVMSHVPLLGVTNPGGSATAVLLVLAGSVAVLTAYLAGRVVTSAKAIRAVAALAYAAGPVTWSASQDGRIGPLVALILLPALVGLAGRIAAGSGSVSSAAGVALCGAAMTAFLPAVGAVLFLVTLAIAVAGRGRGHGQAAMALLGWAALVGPWVFSFRREWATLLGGAGGLAYGASTPTNLDLAVLNLSRSAGMARYAAVPLLAVALVALIRGRARAGTQAVLGLGLILSLAATLTLPRISLAEDDGLITPWWGQAQLLSWGLACAAILVGFSDLNLRDRGRGWLFVRVAPMTIILTAAALLPAMAPVIAGGQGGLAGWSDPRPAIARDQAGAPLANRTLLVGRDNTTSWAQLIDEDRVLLARGAQPNPPTPWPLERSAASAVLDGAAGSTTASLLRTLAVGFVGVDEDTSANIAARLDATAGLIRMGGKAGFNFWRVEPTAAPADGRVGVARVVRIGADGTAVMPVAGPGARVDLTANLPGPGKLVVSSPPQTAAATVVTVDGARVAASPGTSTKAGADPALQEVATYALPAGDVQVRVGVEPSDPWSRWLSLVAALILLFLAVPRIAVRSSR